MEEDNAFGDRYAPLPDAAIRDANDALSGMRRMQPGVVLSTGAQPYAAHRGPYVADQDHHLVQSAPPIPAFLTPAFIGNEEALERESLSQRA